MIAVSGAGWHVMRLFGVQGPLQACCWGSMSTRQAQTVLDTNCIMASCCWCCHCCCLLSAAAAARHAICTVLLSSAALQSHLDRVRECTQLDGICILGRVRQQRKCVASALLTFPWVSLWLWPCLPWPWEACWCAVVRITVAY